MTESIATCYYASQTTVWHTMSSLLHHLRLPPPETRSVLPAAWDPRYIASWRSQQNTPSPNNSSIVIECFTSLLHRNGSSIIACMFISAGTFISSRCVAMNVYSGSAIPVFRRHVTTTTDVCKHIYAEMPLFPISCVTLRSVTSESLPVIIWLLMSRYTYTDYIEGLFVRANPLRCGLSAFSCNEAY
jgi:hypothetical protein